MAFVISACGAFSSAIPNSHESPEALARAVLDAIERRDIETLNNLAIDEQEFRERVWPELPASRPERNLPFSYVWGDLHQKSNAALQQTLARHGGQKYEFVSIGFAGETTPYQSYRVHRESELTVADTAGRQQTLHLFGSVLEKNGRFKVFSYVIP